MGCRRGAARRDRRRRRTPAPTASPGRRHVDSVRSAVTASTSSRRSSRRPFGRRQLELLDVLARRVRRNGRPTPLRAGDRAARVGGRTEQPRLRLTAVVERPTTRHDHRVGVTTAQDAVSCRRRDGTCRPRTAGPRAPCRTTRRRVRSTPVAHTAVPRQVNLLLRRRHAGTLVAAVGTAIDPDRAGTTTTSPATDVQPSTRLPTTKELARDTQAVQVDRCHHHGVVAGRRDRGDRVGTRPCRGRR